MGNNSSNFDSAFGNPSYAHDISRKRILNRDSFCRGIENFKGKRHDLYFTSLRNSLFMSPSIQVVCRKRPLNEKENKCGDFDVISTGKSLFLQNNVARSMWLHKCGFRLDSKHMYIEHHGYEFDSVYDECNTSKDIYDDAALSIVNQCCRGEKGAIIMFGATGSGKVILQFA
jgi:hypothetical protein